MIRKGTAARTVVTIAIAVGAAFALAGCGGNALMGSWKLTKVASKVNVFGHQTTRTHRANGRNLTVTFKSGAMVAKDSNGDTKTRKVLGYKVNGNVITVQIQNSSNNTQALHAHLTDNGKKMHMGMNFGMGSETAYFKKVSG